MTRSNPPIRQRVDALGLQEWAFITSGLVGVALAAVSIREVLQGGVGFGAIVLFLLFSGACYAVVRENVRPEVTGRCTECGRQLVVDSARDSRDRAVTVQFSGPPSRRSFGPLSPIRERERQRLVYCSPTCARLNLGPLREEQEADQDLTAEVPA